MTQTEAVKAVLKDIDYSDICKVEDIQKRLDDVGLKVKLGRGWKVTKSFIKEVKSTGGWCSLELGTPIVDGRGLMWALMQHFKVKNPESYGGHGRQFYSDKACLLAKLDGVTASA